MSRAYRVQWVKASRRVSADDAVKMDVDLLDVLPADEMRAMLRDALTEDGWQKRKDGSLTLSLDGVQVTLSSDGQTLEITHAEEKQVTATATSEKDAARQLDSIAERAEQQLSEEAAKQLAKVEPKVRERFGKSLQRAYVEALKKKAQTLGDVESVRETRNEDGEMELVIKVKA